MFPVIDLGPFAIQAAGLILLFSLWIGIWLTGKFSVNIGANGDAIEDGLLYGLLAGMIGARVGFLLQNPAVFTDNPLSLVSLTPSMLDTGFGILIAGIMLIIVYQRKHLPLWPTLDSISPLILLLFTGAHLSDYANGNNYGLPTSLPWGIHLWNENRHPVQLYVLLLLVFLFIGFLIQTRRFKQTGFLHSGVLFSVSIIGLALITLLTRAFVAEKMIFLGLDLVQIITFLILLFGLYLIYAKAYLDRKHIPVFLSLGANRKPIENLRKANKLIAERFKVRLISSLYLTEDIRDTTEKGQYHNQVLEIESDLSFNELSAWCKDLENQFGRHSGDKDNVPLDVDLIVYNGEVFTSHGKRIPDPSLLHYKYIAVPLAEISPEFRHPGTGQSIQSILLSLEKSGQPIEKLTEVENGTQR